MGLPVPNGPYKVSTLDIEIPSARPQTFSPGKFQIGGKDVFKLETILLTIFYPTNPSSHGAAVQGASWLPPPKMKSVEGLAKYGGIPWYLSWGVAFGLPFFARLPYACNAPLASKSPTLVSDDGASQETPASARPSSSLFPVAIFSHGLAGSRTTYSNYLASLASHGMVVASVEHRDGSGPATTIHRTKDAQPKTLVYFKHTEIDSPPSDVMDMRRAQLELRQAEVLGALDVLKDINDGRVDEIASTNTLPNSDVTKIGLQEWKGRLDMDSIWMLGHSFGGTTTIELLRSNTPFRHALVLDPWLEPIQDSPALEKPLYVINSEAFTIWRPHFKRLRNMVFAAEKGSGKPCWLISMSKTKHTDFSDFPFLMPRIFKTRVDPSKFHALLVDASIKQFISDDSAISRLDVEIRQEKAGEVEARDLGEPGHVINHPLDGNISDA